MTTTDKSVEELLDEIGEYDKATADILDLAVEYGLTGGVGDARVLKRKLQEIANVVKRDDYGLINTLVKLISEESVAIEPDDPYEEYEYCEEEPVEDCCECCDQPSDEKVEEEEEDYVDNGNVRGWL